jgi:hypothetical protein
MTDSPYIFNKNQLGIFRDICLGINSVNEIMRSSGQSNKTVYRITESLTKAGLISRPEGRGTRFSPSTDLHAAALKKYLLSKEHPVDAITGSKLHIMMSICQTPKDIERIAMETGLKRESVRVLTWDLRNYGVLAQDGPLIKISPTDMSMTQFLQDFSKGVNLRLMEERTKVGIMLWSGGLEFIFSTASLEDSSRVRKTGISAMSEYGLQFIADSDYYYYSNWNLELKPEDIAIHNLLANPNSSRIISYSILLLRMNGFDKDYLLEESRYAGIEGLVKEIVDMIEGRPTMNRFMPSLTDMKDLSIQYGVN